MTTRIWTGLVNDDASNPGNWSPSDSAPQPGDRLLVFSSSGIIDITDDALAGNQLTILGSNVTLNLSDHAQANLALEFSRAVANLTGNDFLEADVRGSSAPRPSALAVNLAKHANLHGSFNVGTGASLTIAGGQDTKYIHNATDSLAGATEVVDTKVVGSGTFLMQGSLGKFDFIGSNLEFGGFVAEDQTVDISGAAGRFGPALSRLRVDDPTQFHGAADLHNFSIVDLVGLAQADSWSYANDMLSINGASGRVIDELHVVSDASTTGSVHGLSVSQSAAGDVLVSPGTAFHGSFA